jgi:hypothetical protein
MYIRRFIVHAATDEAARRIWREFLDICREEGREGRMRLASAEESTQLFAPHELPAIVAESDYGLKHVVWRGKTPTTAEIYRLASVFPTPAQIAEARAEELREARESKANAPRSLEDAVRRLIDELSEADRQRLRDTAERDLIQFHHGWGMGIRNCWIYGSPEPSPQQDHTADPDVGGNQALLDSCGTWSPDEASMIIIRAVWHELRATRRP